LTSSEKHQPSDRNHHRPAQALDDSGADKSWQAGCHAAEDGAKGEKKNGNPEDFTGAKPVRRPAARRNENRERNEV
jgi:hypothetical protein